MGIESLKQPGTQEIDGAEIKKQIRSAYLHAEASTILLEEETTEELLARAKKDAEKIKDLPDDAVITFEPYLPSKAEVLVDDPTVYKVVLKEAYRIVGFTGDALEQRTQGGYDHELAHVEPAKGQSTLSVLYGVKFFKDTQDPSLRVVAPFTQFSGKTTFGVWRAINGNPSEGLSKTDHIHAHAHRK